MHIPRMWQAAALILLVHKALRGQCMGHRAVFHAKTWAASVQHVLHACKQDMALGSKKERQTDTRHRKVGLRD